jgi:hypothetical protein
VARPRQPQLAALLAAGPAQLRGRPAAGDGNGLPGRARRGLRVAGCRAGWGANRAPGRRPYGRVRVVWGTGGGGGGHDGGRRPDNQGGSHGSWRQ